MLIISQVHILKYSIVLYSFYEALVEEIHDDHLKVKFDGYTTLETISLQDIKSGSGTKRPSSGDESKYVFLTKCMYSVHWYLRQRMIYFLFDREFFRIGPYFIFSVVLHTFWKNSYYQSIFVISQWNILWFQCLIFLMTELFIKNISHIFRENQLNIFRNT